MLLCCSGACLCASTAANFKCGLLSRLLRILLRERPLLGNRRGEGKQGFPGHRSSGGGATLCVGVSRRGIRSSPTAMTPTFVYTEVNKGVTVDFPGAA